MLEVRSNLNIGIVVVSNGKALYLLALKLHAVEVSSCGSSTAGCKVEFAPLAIQFQHFYAPILSRSYSLQPLAVKGLEVNLLPHLKIPYHIEAFICKDHLLRPIYPTLLMLRIDVLFRAIQRIYRIENESILTTRHPRNYESVALGIPKGNSKILVAIHLKICPNLSQRTG